MNLAALFSKDKREINLLPKDPFETSLVGRALNWGLVVGKWIVITTQMIVVGIFLFRFSLDRKLNNLRRDVEAEVVKIKAYATIEDNFRLAQARLVLAKPILEEQEKMKASFPYMAQLMPNDIWLEKIEVNKNQISLIAYAYSMTGFNQFLENLKGSGNFRQVSIQNIESGVEKQAKLKFSLVASFKDEDKKE